MISDNRRAFKRVSRRLTVLYCRHGEHGSGHGSSFTENISTGGVYFNSLEKVPIGTLMDCRVDCGSFGECSFLSRVVRCDDMGGGLVRSFGIAVEFVKPSGDSDKRLEACISGA
ncbi:MAG: PilZ domain-containing protein [Candidatus Omnitrophica bacterium]|jgi:hypothetical protein|nr:PilZ domain-containing protein [Candidatus Omnitrophota bacterium]